MRRVFVVLAVCTCALSLLLAGSWRLGAIAQEGTPDAAAHPVVGTWREIAMTEGAPPLHLTTVFTSDGTIIGAGAPAFPSEPGVVTFIGPGTGVWEATGPNSVAYTVDLMLADAEGMPAGRLTVHGTREVSADGQTFTGDYTNVISAPDGTVLFSIPGVDEGTRLTVETMPVASPEATPAT
jgi:hypothetical protein